MPPIPTRALVALQDPDTHAVRLVAPHEAMVSAFDRSFHFGDSLYEVARTYDGILFSLDEHMRRLQSSADLARFGPLPPRLDELMRSTCREFFRRFGNVDVYVRLTVSRGVGDLHIDRQMSGPPYAVVICKELGPRPPLDEVGAHWALVHRRRNLPAALDPAMKSGNYLNNVLALAEAKALGADDALMLDHRGRVTEGTTSNFYAVVGGVVWTAPLAVGILRGVTRDWVLQVCREQAIPLEEREFSAEDVLRADELMLSSSTREVQAITELRLPGEPMPQVVGQGRPGPITRRIHAALRETIAAWCTRHRAESLFVQS